MIKANELRIGNLVGHHDSDYASDDDGIHFVATVVELLERTIIVGDRPMNLRGSLSYQEAIPIPLTEEWLEKFGFEIGEVANEDGDEHSFFSIRKPNGKSLYIERDYQPTDCGFPIVDYRLLHVHQLQNLYHSLTGEELTIKEPV